MRAGMGFVGASVAWIVTVGITGAVAAETLVLQRGVEYAPGKVYSGVKDLSLSQAPASAYGEGGGGKTSGGTYDSNSENELFLLQFDLAPLTELRAGSILGATLSLYNFSLQWGGTARAKQMGLDWTEGTAIEWSSTINGAGHRNRHPPKKLVDGDWQLDSGTTYKYPAPSALAVNQKVPADPAARWVFGSAGGALVWHDVCTAPRTGSTFTALADLQAASPPFAHGFGYYYDGGANVLYARADGGGIPQNIYVVDQSNTWDWVGRLAPGAWQGDFDASPGQGAWHTNDATIMVRKWLGLDGETKVTNCGLQVDGTVPAGSGHAYYLSEYLTDTNKRPKLTITFEPIAPQGSVVVLH